MCEIQSIEKFGNTTSSAKIWTNSGSSTRGCTKWNTNSTAEKHPKESEKVQENTFKSPAVNDVEEDKMMKIVFGSQNLYEISIKMDQKCQARKICWSDFLKTQQWTKWNNCGYQHWLSVRIWTKRSGHGDELTLCLCPNWWKMIRPFWLKNEICRRAKILVVLGKKIEPKLNSLTPPWLNERFVSTRGKTEHIMKWEVVFKLSKVHDSVKVIEIRNSAKTK